MVQLKGRRLIAAMLASTGIALISAPGIAHADPLAGKTYAEATAEVAKWGSAKLIISTIVGGTLELDDCIVTSSQKTSSVQNNFEHRSGMLVALNCTAKLAGAGVPGNSAASVEGRTQKKNETTADWINNNSDGTKWCLDNADKCKGFCDTTKLCSSELSAQLG